MNNFSELSNTNNLRPVFIGGCDRSGTTLLGSMLGDCIDHICTPESLFKNHLFGRFNSAHNLSIEEVKTIIYGFRRNIRFMGWELLFEDDQLIRRVEGKTVTYFLNEIIKLYGKQHLKKEESKVWIDHSPDNIGMIPTLLKFYPGASFIHIVRDARAVVASLLGMDWGPSNIITACYFWQAKIGQALANEKYNPNAHISTIKYEELILNPVSQLERICNEANLTYSSTMLNGQGMFTDHILTKNSHSLLGKNLAPQKINSWRKRLSKREVEIIESICGDMLTNLGYEVDYGIKAKPTNQKERVEILGKEIILKLNNYLSQKKLNKRLRKKFKIED